MGSEIVALYLNLLFDICSMNFMFLIIPITLTSHCESLSAIWLILDTFDRFNGNSAFLGIIVEFLSNVIWMSFYLPLPIAPPENE